MPLPFSRSLRSIEADSFRPSLIAIAVALALVAAWVAWFTLARVELYELSSEARVEAASAAHAVDAATAGTVVQVTMVVGQEVVAGDALVTLDTDREASKVAEESARLDGITARLAALAQSRAAAVDAADSQRRADRNAIAAAEARQQQAASALRVAEAAARRSAELREQGLASAADLEGVLEAAEQQRSAVAAAQSDLARARWQQQQNESTHRASLADWDRQIAGLESERLQLLAAEPRFGREVADRVIRAPISGRLGEVADLRPGAVVAAGERIAVVIPTGEVMVVARFPTATALGRVHSAQSAKLRLDAFPWVYYGQVLTEVTRVGSEASDGAFRVELRVVEVPAALRLEHGLTGSVAVAVERVSPATLVLRSVGKRLGVAP